MRAKRRDEAARLLSEFLVSLGLLFLLLIANVAILDSSVKSSFGAATENVALDLARNCMEESVARPGSQPGRKSHEIDGTTYVQTVRQVNLDGDRAGLILLSVDVEWEAGGQSHLIRLERYARRS